MPTIDEILSFGIKIQGHEFLVLDLVQALIILLITIVVLRLINAFYNRKFEKKKAAEKGRIISLKQITKYFIWTIAIVLIIQNFNYDITLLLAGSAALLVGVGLGLQHTFNDIFSGFIILFEGSVKVGDVVQIEELIGTVKEIGIRTSRVETQDRIQIIVPNSKLVTEYVINWSKNNPLTRFKVTVSVAYGSDIVNVKRILMECAEKHEDIEKEPRPIVEFSEFGKNGLVFNLMFYTRIILPMWKIRSDLRFSINEAFNNNGITIPFPQRDLHIKKGDIPVSDD